MRGTQRILVIDDEREIGEFIADAAQAMGLECTSTTEPGHFLELLSTEISLVILDLKMPFIDGIELLRLLGEYKFPNGVVLMSGLEDRILETAEQLAITLGLSVVGRLKKPFGLEKLGAVLRLCQQSIVKEPRRPEVAEIKDEEIQAAVARGDFVLHYQPQVDIQTRRVVGLEGLVRWLHPQLGVVYPDRFIQRANELNLIDQLGWSVLQKGIASWRALAEDLDEAPTLSLNVATCSLRDLMFPDKVAELLTRYSMPADKLILEITESGLLEHLSSTLDVLTRLRLKGVQLAVDDFGTGYSMLQQLRSIPATELKIDRSFIRDMLSSYEDRVLVQKTIEIGRQLKLRMVAEGIETQEQWDYLSRQRCDVAQGYLIYKPQPFVVVRSWLQQYQPMSHFAAQSNVLQ